jgi:hypothetical protein
MRWAEGTYVSTDEFANRFRVLQSKFDAKAENRFGLLRDYDMD